MGRTVKDLLREKDDRWRTKGHPHPEKEFEPVPCPVCSGFGVIYNHTCEYCGGLGEVSE
jgi:DnaJ-class molecular chaperone